MKLKIDNIKKYLQIALITILTIIIIVISLNNLNTTSSDNNLNIPPSDKITPNVVILRDGLGNQMFLYAFGRALEIKSGRKVVFDDSSFKLDKNRAYNLDIFNLNIEFLSPKYNYNNEYIEEKNPYRYDKSLFKHNKAAFFGNFFQNEKYFKDIKEIIIKDFTFPQIAESDKFNQYWLKRIKEEQNPVFIHIRKGDYVDIKWDLKNNYYYNAVNYMNKHLKNPKYFVFCIDCDDFLKNEFRIDAPYEIIGDTNNKTGEDWKDMYLMTQFKHAILANSTFSWWGAWLGPEQKGGIIIAPSPFLQGQDDIVCDNWIKIKQ